MITGSNAPLKAYRRGVPRACLQKLILLFLVQMLLIWRSNTSFQIHLIQLQFNAEDDIPI